MRSSALLQLFTATTSIAANVALPYGIELESANPTSLVPNLGHVPHQQPLTPAAMAPPGDSNSGSDNDIATVQAGVMLSDVMGKDRSINLFAGFARDVAAVTHRLDSASDNSTVLAPLNSAVEALPRKPWEDPRDYGALGAGAYEGQDGPDRAQRNLERFVEAHILPTSPWDQGVKVRSLLGENDREVWWEVRDGKKIILPDEIEVASVASKVGNGEVWIIKGVRNYA